MEDKKTLDYLGQLLKNMPSDWLYLTTHRLDIYEEKSAKTQFLEQLAVLYARNDASAESLAKLPTAFDYIRLGHPLSCLLEWAIARAMNTAADNVIAFSSTTMAVLAILRKNKLANEDTRIVFTGKLPAAFDVDILQRIYGYTFDLLAADRSTEIGPFEGSTILLSKPAEITRFTLIRNVDFYVNIDEDTGSILLFNGGGNEGYVPDIQHVRRRETIAMTPADCYAVLSAMVNHTQIETETTSVSTNRDLVEASVREINGRDGRVLLGSSGLSVQYAIMMGLIHDAKEKHPDKAIKIIVPPNCYGGTNDQARRVAAAIDNVTIVDLPVDGGQDMVQSIEVVLDQMAAEDAVPYIIAEIPTNPRVEVPDLHKLRDALTRGRKTPEGSAAIDPVFILDQTFCPNVRFLEENGILAGVRTISYASGSKFPSGGLCTAGYCLGNKRAEGLMDKVATHLRICDNEATDFQVEILAKQLPSMKQRIQDAYENTREFVGFIKETLPAAKINFVSEELAGEGFTPSVFSLDLPTHGATDEEREQRKRALNYQLINRMIEEIPGESKFCVSYGQLKGCYWTIPATSTQGTTKEGDKDYIVRASLSPSMDIERHKEVFREFVGTLTD